MKKLIVMLLVLVMMVSILVMPAMAAEIQPRYPAARCPQCGRGADFWGPAVGGGYIYFCEYCHLEFTI